MSDGMPANYEQAAAWLRDSLGAGDERFGPAEPAKQAAHTAAAQAYALMAIADAVQDLRADVTAGVAKLQRQLEVLTQAVGRLP